MSFLGDKIKLVIHVVQKKAKDELYSGIMADVSNEIFDLKNLVEEKLKNLQNTQNFRVYDETEGGVLRGPIRSRKRYESKHKYKLLCHERYMTKGSGKTPSEVPYMRALFNDRNMNGYDIIAYETPLMRKKRGREDGRALSCDLMGLRETELCCIEVKTVPDNNATYLPYALLEGFSYAACLNWIIDNHAKEINQELGLCCKSFGFSVPSFTVNKATFAIAAPKDDYFKPYATKVFKNHSSKWFQLRIKESEIIQKAILQNYKDWFSGYMLLSQPVQNCKAIDIKDETVMPAFNHRNIITRYSSINDLVKALSK